MASTPSFVAFVLEQLAEAGPIAHRKMFGEHCLLRDGRMVALISQDRVFVKPTSGGEAFAGPCERLPPCSALKPYLVVPGERLDDAAWLSELVRITARELPPPKPKKRAIRRGRKQHAGP
jgi:TfoX/Sxy family transcriptional regulator of competence genes